MKVPLQKSKINPSMRKVLLIDGSPLFTQFLTDKFKSEQVALEYAESKRDAYTKLITIIPDLIIIETADIIDTEIQELLEKKSSDPNARKIPIIITGPVIERSSVANLVQFGVVKYFTKPIKFDVFFQSVSHILGASFSMDTTPCVLDIHLNQNIIFVELARGLNREKIILLKYRIMDIIEKNQLNTPKLVLMLTNLSLTFMDISNLELLFTNLTADGRISKNNVKILSLSEFVKDIIDGHPEYYGYEVTDNLGSIMGSLIESRSSSRNINEVINNRILETTDDASTGSIEMRNVEETPAEMEEEGTVMKVAVVDDDVVIRKILQSTLNTISAETFLFPTGAEFLQAVNSKQQFDLVILDIFIPDIDGFSILQGLQRQNFETPILVYSQATQKEAVIQALSLGAKSYLVKPQKPNVIIKKALEVVNGQFHN